MTDAELWTFDRFEEGRAAPAVEVVLDAAKRAEWEAVFGTASALPSRGLLAVAMTQGFIGAFQPRPRGNVHAGQVLDYTGVRPAWGDRLSVTVACAAREVKKGRNWIDFRAELRCRDELVLTGTYRIIWAA